MMATNCTKGGKSRASKKRAKKKQKKADGLESSASGSTNNVVVASSNVRHRMDVCDEITTQNDNSSAQRNEPQGTLESNKKKRSRVGVAAEPNSDESTNLKTEGGAEQDFDEQTRPPNESTNPKTEGGAEQDFLDEQTRPPNDCKLLMDLIQRDPKHSSVRNWAASKRANCALNFLLQPAGITAKEFYDGYWEQEALVIQQSSSNHRHRFDGILSRTDIKDMTQQKPMRWGKDLNVTRYQVDQHGVKRRVTLDLIHGESTGAGIDDNGEEQRFVKADPEVVWDHYEQGCTIRLLCPHQHSDNVHSLLHMMELEWGCMVGANAYLTPPRSSQGFAPHFDDIEAFVLQLEGKKRWKVYKPQSKGETLPRQSSPDFTEEDLKDVKVFMDVTLCPGDVLYMPRGWIHQACTLPDVLQKDGHSLHLTVSAMQQWAWVDLMEIVVPEALQAATASETSTALREGLPRRFLDYMGAAHSNKEVPELLKAKKEDSSVDSKELAIQHLQENFRREAKARIMRVAKEAMELLDASCDQISKQYLSACQPPPLSHKEVNATSVGQKTSRKITPDALVRLVRPGVARLILEDEKAVLYHCLENSREYHGNPLRPMEFELDDGPAIEQLLSTTDPQWICVNDLFHDSIEEKVGVCQALDEEGLLMIRE